MRRHLETLEEAPNPRSVEEYLGAFTESFKMILHQNPVERIGHSVWLAAKTALRLKAAKPSLREHEIAARLQELARNIRLTTILNDLTPEEKKMVKVYSARDKARRSLARRRPAARKSVRARV